jgi:hypothetical protein
MDSRQPLTRLRNDGESFFGSRQAPTAGRLAAAIATKREKRRIARCEADFSGLISRAIGHSTPSAENVKPSRCWCGYIPRAQTRRDAREKDDIAAVRLAADDRFFAR